MLGVSLQKLCFDYAVQNLGAFPPAVLSLLPLTIRQEMLPLMCVADVYRMEASGFTKDMDTGHLWKGFYKEYYNEASEFFPKDRDESKIDWKEDFSTALGYHALHHCYVAEIDWKEEEIASHDHSFNMPCNRKSKHLVLNRPLVEVLFGSGLCLHFVKYTSSTMDGNSASYFDQLMEVFEYIQFRCKKLVLKLNGSFLRLGIIRRLVHSYNIISSNLEVRDVGSFKITNLFDCMEIYCSDYFNGMPIFETLFNVDFQHTCIIHFYGRKFSDIIPLVKQPLLQSVFVSNGSIQYEFLALWNLLYSFFLNTTSQEQTFSVSVKNVTDIDRSCKLRCSEGSCKSFLCATTSRGFYEWFFSNSLVLKHLKVCATGTKVLHDLHNLDIYVQHLELDCHCIVPSAAILSIRELQALTLEDIRLSDLCAFLMSALQSKLNLHFLCFEIYNMGNYAENCISDQWYLTQLFYSIFSFPELETLECRNKLSDLVLDALFTAWKYCGERKLKRLTVLLSHANDCNVEKLNRIAMAVTLL